MRHFFIFFILMTTACFGQIPNLPQRPGVSNLYSIPEGLNNKATGRPTAPQINANSGFYKKVTPREDQEEINKEVERQISMLREESYAKNYMLTSLSDRKGTDSYYRAFDNLTKFDPENYSITDAVFIVENAYNNNDRNFQAAYQQQVQKATKIIRQEIKKSGIQESDNVAKNLSIFKYFAQDTKQDGKIIHKAIKYDFDDYMGAKEYSKMFVSKLMKTNSGQCHSMPLLYLILAEQIGAEAFLVMSPNHSYIRFKDNDGEVLSVELTNGMFSANSFVLNSGYIKAEALKNKLYMQNLTKKDVLSQTYVDLASGYIHKFGYDEFVAKVLGKALELNPNNINATLWKSNTDQMRFMQACNRLGIDPENKEQLQKIRNYPPLEDQFLDIKAGFDYIDQSGFALMPSEQYEKWLGSLQTVENKQKSEEIAERLRILNAQKQREVAKKAKSIIPKKESPKVYAIPKEFL